MSTYVNKSGNPLKDRRYQVRWNQGFSLIEVLVSLVILSVGLLGIAGLQVRSLKATQDTVQRNTAAMLTKDIIERMRSNLVEASKGTSGNYNNKPGTAATLSKCTSATGTYLSCPPAVMAQADLYDWQTTVAALLPLGIGTVCMATVPSSSTTLTPISCNTNAPSTQTVFAVIVKWTHGQNPQQTLAIAFDPGVFP